MLKIYQTFQKYKVPETLQNYVFNSTEAINLIEEFNKVNIFVGGNNSGKSKLIREILKQKNNYRYYCEKNKSDILKVINEIFEKMQAVRSIVGMTIDFIKSQNGQFIYNFQNWEYGLNKNALITIDADYDINETINQLKTWVIQSNENINLRLGSCPHEPSSLQ